MGIKSGTVLDFQAEKDTLLAVKVVSEDPVSMVFGCLRLPQSSDELLRELRGEERMLGVRL